MDFKTLIRRAGMVPEGGARRIREQIFLAGENLRF